MRACWSSRSSKPLPRHDVSGGRFDSYSLRQPLSCSRHFRKEVIAGVARGDFQADCAVLLCWLSYQTQPAGSDAGSASATNRVRGLAECNGNGKQECGSELKECKRQPMTLSAGYVAS